MNLVILPELAWFLLSLSLSLSLSHEFAYPNFLKKFALKSHPAWLFANPFWILINLTQILSSPRQIPSNPPRILFSLIQPGAILPPLQIKNKELCAIESVILGKYFYKITQK
jgi:hypothetical protein